MISDKTDAWDDKALERNRPIMQRPDGTFYVETPETRKLAEDKERLDTQLDMIARQIQGWLDWDVTHRTEADLKTDENTSIMALPVPKWPTHGQLMKWVEVIQEARSSMKGR